MIPTLSSVVATAMHRYLIWSSESCATFGNFTFSATGQLLSFNLPRLPEILADGVAFQTSGCPDCNRPFYNERPGGPMYNYPKALTSPQIEVAVEDVKRET